jgi:hypothetical protein
MSAPDVPLVGMTDEQRFIFDLKGWLLLRGVLEPPLLTEIQEYLQDISARRAEIGSQFHRASIKGPAQELIDHPAIVGILREIVGPDTEGGAYGFRCESSFFIHRAAGESGWQPPHSGPIVGPLAYRVLNGRVWSGLTRVIWELSDVTQPEGGTAVLSGSHKMNFPLPDRLRTYDPSIYEGYTCPAGSVLIMSESCWHYGAPWKDTTHKRLVVLNCYNHYLSQWHRLNLAPEVIEAMPPQRQTAFRGVWAQDIRRRVDNDYFALDNQAL